MLAVQPDLPMLRLDSLCMMVSPCWQALWLVPLPYFGALLAVAGNVNRADPPRARPFESCNLPSLASSAARECRLHWSSRANSAQLSSCTEYVLFVSSLIRDPRSLISGLHVMWHRKGGLSPSLHALREVEPS